jgi:hypothetical protein
MSNRRKSTKNDLRIELMIEILRAVQSIAILLAGLEHLC